MLTLKDLDNRVYSGKICLEYSYILKDQDADSQVYTFGYIMPKSNLPLELIAATGLKYFQLYLKEEIQTKSEYDFMLGDVLKGM